MPYVAQTKKIPWTKEKGSKKDKRRDQETGRTSLVQVKECTALTSLELPCQLTLSGPVSLVTSKKWEEHHSIGHSWGHSWWTRPSRPAMTKAINQVAEPNHDPDSIELDKECRTLLIWRTLILMNCTSGTGTRQMYMDTKKVNLLI